MCRSDSETAVYSLESIMAKGDITIPLSKIKAPKPRKQNKPCQIEYNEVKACMDDNPDDLSVCVDLRLKYHACVKESMIMSKQKAHKPPINYHLGRLARKALEARRR